MTRWRVMAKIERGRIGDSAGGETKKATETKESGCPAGWWDRPPPEGTDAGMAVAD